MNRFKMWLRVRRAQWGWRKRTYVRSRADGGSVYASAGYAWFLNCIIKPKRRERAKQRASA